MSDIIPLLASLTPHLSSTTMRQLRHVIDALLCIPNQATMLGLSRWAEKGGSYRTIHRLYHTPLNWLLLHWTLIKIHVLKPTGCYVLAGDEVVVSKAGKKTHGVGRFYSGLAQRVIPSVSLLALAVIDVQQRRSYPLHIQQLVPAPSHAKNSDPPAKRPRGRPKGSQNYVKPDPVLSPVLHLLAGMLGTLHSQIAHLAVNHIVLDGKFGNYPATWTVRQAGLHSISKLRHDAAVYVPDAGAKPARGPTPRYGDKLNYAQLPAAHLVATHIEDDERVETYQIQAYHKDYPDLLNVVVIVKTQLGTGKRGHVVLFSTDLDLTADQIVDYYSLRFQIEFNFRDAKQYWGLEDFMNVAQTAVTNAVNLAFLMVNLSHLMLKPYRDHDPTFSVLDLKALFRARRYLSETIKLLPQMPPPDLISRIWQRLARLGGIRARPLHD
ncbi:MAG: transposase, partial [Chloroflexi bacterium]|nr:transposase [Chloroflexota bacterium]